MKKYVASLIPFIFCAILSFVYAAKTPRHFPYPAYPYQTEGTLAYLSTTWFYIGLIISAAFMTMFIIGDIFDFVIKLMKNKRRD